MKNELTIEDYVFAGYSALVVETSEESRVIDECLEIAQKCERKLYFWSETKGLNEIFLEKDEKKEKLVDKEVPPDESVLQKSLELGENAIICVLDFHPYIKTPIVWRTAKDVFETAKNIGVTYVFVSNKFEVPQELEQDVTVTNIKLPDKEDLKNIAVSLCELYNIEIPDNIDDIVDISLGLTTKQAEDVFSISLSKEGILDVNIIIKAKEAIICGNDNSLLEYHHSKESFDTIGGMKGFIDYANERISAYSKEAQDYGLPYPKGVLLVGIPGCGKSLSAKGLANAWQKPLLKLDLGKLFGSLVGETESRVRKALELAEAMAPAVLWIDEIEKGLSGVSSSGMTDSGVTSRMFGTILTWLQEKESPVFVIATANNISSLPPELSRKGRFDEIFFVDLPDQDEIKAILKIHIEKNKKTNRKAEEFDLDSLSKLLEGYTGAEIEEVIISSMFYAFNDGKRPYTDEDIKRAIGSIVPMSSGAMKSSVASLRDWSREHNVRRANGTKKVVSNNVAKSTNGRRVIMNS